MRIGLNATCFNERPSGAKQRFVGIYGKVFKQLKNVEFVIFEPSDCAVSDWFPDIPNITVRKTPIPSEGRVKKIIKGFRYWNSVSNSEHFDFFENFNLPSNGIKANTVCHTVHDIRGLYPKWESYFKNIEYNLIMKDMLRKTDRIITVSESMKQEIFKFYPDASISVIYNGINISELDNISEVDKVSFMIKYKLPAKFLLSVGHLEKRKNYLNLIDAIAQIHEKGQKHHLVIIGNDSGEGQAIRKKIESMNLSLHITILTNLSDKEVRCAYSQCSLFIFPSYYEGFGIPILEAMAANCPMIMSDIPVFREITENKGMYFSPDDSDHIAKVIEKVLASPEIMYTLVQYGKKRVLDFSFKKIATNLKELYIS